MLSEAEARIISSIFYNAKYNFVLVYLDNYHYYGRIITILELIEILN